MDISLNTIQNILGESFGFLEKPRRLEGGLSHDVYSLDEAGIIVKIYSLEVSKERLDTEQRALEILETSSLVTAPTLILNKDGTSRLTIGSVYLSCFRKIEGDSKFSLTVAPTVESEIADIGYYLGLLHRDLLAGSQGLIPGVGPILNVARSIAKHPSDIDRLVSKLLLCDAPYFLIHGDFQQSNLLYVKDYISGVIDFEYATPDFRVIDIAGCLSNLISGNSDYFQREDLVSLFINSYIEGCDLPLTRVEDDVIRELITVLWNVNLFWVNEKLSTTKLSANRTLLECYKNQLLKCLGM